MTHDPVPLRRSGRLKAALVFAAACCVAPTAGAQDARPDESVIEDNSFLIEEAYNQEPGVIQHISNLVHASPWSEGEFAYSLTEEWPVTGQTHQLGFTLPYYNAADPGGNGIGDILINYRYQLFAGDVALAPRVSLIVPTGDESLGHGSGVVGLQFNLPASRRLGRAFVGHLNAGLTVLPGVEGPPGGGAASNTLTSFAAGGSLIWLAGSRFNLHLEALLSNEAEPDVSGGVARGTEYVLNPAARYAIDFGSLQVVPGFGLPILLRDGADPETSFFLYLSLEHPVGF